MKKNLGRKRKIGRVDFFKYPHPLAPSPERRGRIEKFPLDKGG
jgi:hypothetical protein